MCPIENVASRTREQSRPNATCWWQETSWFLDESSANRKPETSLVSIPSEIPCIVLRFPAVLLMAKPLRLQDNAT
jgi:hypothetical protein